MRGSGHAGDATILLCEHRFDLGTGEFSLADLHERSDDSAAHLIKKTLAFDDKRQAGAASFEIATGQRAHCGFPSVAGI